MSGIVGILANDSARFSLFTACVSRLELPPGWRKEFLIGGDWCGARNSLVKMVLESDTQWLWFMDDDHAFSPDILLRLLQHDLPLVVPVCLTRSAPFAPVTYTERIEGSENASYLPVYLPEQEESGLVELVAGGSAGMLIHREVLEALDEPWFEYGFASEDLMFCDKAMEAGFSLHCDLGARLGHLTTAAVWPTVYDGEWCVGLDVGSVGQTTRVLLPIETKSVEQNV
jgi:Fringe-like